MTVWINEFHYDNTGTDTGEFIELAGTAGTDLTGWSLVLYNGNGGAVYDTLALTGTIPNLSNGFGTLAFFIAGIQNGAPDGIALAQGSTLVQFLSYEGSFTAVGGVANGETSTDIGVDQDPTPAAGASLHLVGSGDAYGDFTWAATPTNSAGAVNAGQSFGAPPAGATVSVTGTSVLEGNSGTVSLVFTVTRSNADTAFTVDFTTANGTATAGSDFAAAAGTLTFLAGGELSQTVNVTVTGDTAFEPDETLTLTLSNLVPTTGTTTLGTDTATGTITNDDVALTRIFDIQGGGHKSGFVGGDVTSFGNSGSVRVTTEGVVTAIAQNGFYIQDATGDGNDATSDGIFVFLNATPAESLTVGETVRVTARVDEFRPGGSGGTNNLTITQLNATQSGSSVVELGGNTVIDAVVLGVERFIPTGQVSDAGFGIFDIATDAIDFWESLEGMLVEVPQSVATSPTSEFRSRDPLNSAIEGPPNEEIWVYLPANHDAASLTPRGGLMLGQTDPNPERVQIDDIRTPVDLPDVAVGAILGPVQGVVNYDFTNYEVLVSTAPVVVTPSALEKEVTALERDARQVTIASYNVLNLDPKVEDPNNVAGSDAYNRLGNVDDDGGATLVVDPVTGAVSGSATGRFKQIADDIVLGLKAPSIVALQEIQDSDGAEISSVVDATLTLQTLVDAIQVLHGIVYSFAEVPPPGSNQDGGQPNANIRPAFLYRADEVTLTGVSRLTDPNPGEPAPPAPGQPGDLFPGDDFGASRKPLVGEFEANGVAFTVINNHLNSKGGDNGIFGNVQPPVLSSENQRIEQAEIIRAEVEARLAADADARIVVLGDLNDFGWSAPLQALQNGAGGQVLWNLNEQDPINARYSYNFQGNAQALDHILATGSLTFAGQAMFDAVHRNAEFTDGASDHDPLLALFDLRAFGETLEGTRGVDEIDGFAGDDRLFGLAGDDDMTGGAGDDLVNGGAGNDVIYGDDGNDTLLGLAGNDTLYGGADNDDLQGGAGNDLVYGEEGNDTLRGNDGDDVLVGGAGDDLLLGGAGADRFVFGADDGTDTINAFLRAQGDRIVLTGGDLVALTFDADSFTYGSTVVNVASGNPLQASDFLFA